MEHEGRRSRQTIMVPFAGEGSGAEELTWGQWGVWRIMQGFDSPFMVGGAMRLEEGSTLEPLEGRPPLDPVAGWRAFIVGRHESRRTRVGTGPDGEPMQVLSESGEVAL